MTTGGRGQLRPRRGGTEVARTTVRRGARVFSWRQRPECGYRPPPSTSRPDTQRGAVRKRYSASPRVGVGRMDDSATAARQRIRGNVVRWGTRGYGFISSPELPREAWCHVNFIVDPDIAIDRPLAIGMELEFEPRTIEGGRIQAREVTRPSAALASPLVARAMLREGGHEWPAIEEAPAPSVPAKPPQSELRDRSPAARAGESLAVRVAAERDRISSERLRLQAEGERLLRDAEALDAEVAEVLRDFDDRISELQRERDRRLADLRREAQQCRLEAETLWARRDSLPSVSAKSMAILAEDFRRAHAELADWLDRQARSREEVARERAAAVAATGEHAVRDYEETRRRLEAASDDVDRRAYSLAQRDARIPVENYAAALDRSGRKEAAQLGLVVLVPDDPVGRLVLVVPVAAEDIERDDLSWRIATFLFDTAERAAKEVDATVIVGSSSGCLAVELRPWAVEPELIDIAVQDAWNARPSLAAAFLSVSCELVPGVDPPFEAIEAEEDVHILPGPASGGDLRHVATRLGLSLADLIASLCASGLPFPDDVIDAGAEESLRALLHYHTQDEHRLEEETATPSPAASAPLPDRSSPPMIARRLLERLLRDTRIGGRYTAERNVWGHHFADDEKDVARELMRRLVRCGILLSRSKPGGDYVSIDPRRIDDVQRLIELNWNDPSLFKRLE